MNKFDIGEVWLSDFDQDEYEIVYVGEKEFVAKNLKDNALYLFHCDGKSIYDKRRLVKKKPILFEKWAVAYRTCDDKVEIDKRFYNSEEEALRYWDSYKFFLKAVKVNIFLDVD